MNRSLVLAPFAVAALAGSAWAFPFSFTATDTPVSDQEPNPITSTINVGVGGTITDLDALVDLSDSFMGDVQITLTHVDTGTSAILYNFDGGASANLTGVTFDDEAGTPIAAGSPPYGPGSFQPDSPLSVFDGENILGTWTLTAIDVVDDGDGHTINSFGLIGTATPEPGTFALFGLGAAAVGAVGVVRRRRLKKPA